MNIAALVCWLAGQGQPPSHAPFERVHVIETFDHGSNRGNWSFFGNPDNPVEVIESSGGNPGAFLHSTCQGLNCLDTFAPELRAELGVASIFTGDYRAKGVFALGVDLAVLDVDFSSAGRPLTVILANDGGTPGDSSDDIRVYRVGSRYVPPPDGRWRHFRFHVPSRSSTLPSTWRVLQGTGNDDADWNTVLGDVSQVSFFFGDPEFFFIFQQWELGADNLVIGLDRNAL